MNSIEVKPVSTARERRAFLTFPWKIYRHDPLWVPPLLPQRSRTIDPQHGTFFQRGEAEFFIAWRDRQPIGTICAAEDGPTNQARGTKECMFGFFEYIEDYDVVEALLNRAIEWARIHDLNALFGPFNLDYEDSYGVLIAGRDRPPALLCGHSPFYYQGFIERFGFQPARAENIALSIYEDESGLDRLYRVAERVQKRGKISIRQADFEHWDEEIDRVVHLLNIALAHLNDHIGWRGDSLDALLSPFREIADPELILFAEVEGETVGFLPGVPNLNEAFIHANGLRYPWDYLKLWWHMRHQTECLAIKSVLVLPEYWNRGVAVLLFAEMAQRAIAKGYKWADLSITSIDNPNTVLLAKHMGAQIYKRWQVYRLFI